MSAALKLNLESEHLSRKPPLGENRPRLKLVWENPQLSADGHREKSKARLSTVSGQTLYSYVYNNPLKFIDPTGLDATVTLYPGALGAGHVGIGVNTPNTTGFYPAPGASTFDIATGQPVPGVMQPDTRTPTDTITIPTTPAQDRAIQDFINQRTQNPGNYDLNDRNCTTTVRDALGAGGVNTPETIFPKTLFENLQQQFAPRP